MTALQVAKSGERWRLQAFQLGLSFVPFTKRFLSRDGSRGRKEILVERAREGEGEPVVRTGLQEQLTAYEHVALGISVHVLRPKSQATRGRTGVSLTPGNCVATRLLRIPQP